MTLVDLPLLVVSLIYWAGGWPGLIMATLTVLALLEYWAMDQFR